MPPTEGVADVATRATDGVGDSNAALAANSSLSVPFSCGFCQRSFPRLSLLKKHEQVWYISLAQLTKMLINDDRLIVGS